MRMFGLYPFIMECIEARDEELRQLEENLSYIHWVYAFLH